MNPNTPRRPRSHNTNDVRPFDATTSHVVLPDGTLVHVDNASLTDLERRGITGRWSSYCNGHGRTYVSVNLPAHLGAGSTTVASLIVNRRPGEGVRYANGSRFDLRLCNLAVTSRGSGRRRSMQSHAALRFPGDPERQAAWLQREAAKTTRPNMIPKPVETIVFSDDAGGRAVTRLEADGRLTPVCAVEPEADRG